MQPSHHTLLQSLQELKVLTETHSKVEVGQIIALFYGRGYPALIAIFSFPFCLPIQIPGFSTPFGIFLAFMGLRIAFSHTVWCPQWIKEKSVSSQHLEKVIAKTIVWVQKSQKFLRPRWPLLNNHFAHRLHGMMISLFALLLALPLPIPFTNVLVAFPILSISLGMLEDDGMAIVVGYLVAAVGLITFIWLLHTVFAMI